MHFRYRLAIGLLGLLALGTLAFVLGGQYAAGNIYPQYSSLRTDRLGTRALYEALERTHPRVTRNYLPLGDAAISDSVVFIAGVASKGLSPDFVKTTEALAAKGNRVVIAADGADLRPGPGSEKRVGKGSVAMVATSVPFTNEGLRDARDLALIRWAIPDGTRVVFDESHLGSVENGTIMGLARQFRLQGFIAVLMVCALLFIWRSSMPFPPERSVAQERDFELAAASAGEGLRNLLTRHIPPAKIIEVCVKESGRDSIPAVSDPVAAWNELRGAKKRK